MNENTEKPLNPDWVDIIKSYINIDSETYGDGAKCVIASGKYSQNPGSARTQWSRIVNNQGTKRLMEELLKEQIGHFTQSKILSDLEYARRRALKNNQLGSALKATELTAKICGYLKESFIPVQEEQRIEVDLAKREQAKRLSAILLEQGQQNQGHETETESSELAEVMQ